MGLHAPHAGVQDMGREHRGELWGMPNMFRENAEGGVAAHDIIAEGRADALYRIQECDPRLLGAQHAAPPLSVHSSLHTRQPALAG